MGSSPLARGLQISAAPGFSFRGIIPARAGFTGLGPADGARAADHPRSRGVYLRGRRALVSGAGSSPLARGLLDPSPEQLRAGRIIPARAGFTCCSPLSRTRPADHPRSRGFYSWPATGGRTRRGSSPLARGLRRPRRPGQVLPRIIPARAGFTRRSARRSGRREDHPRSRGVYRFQAAWAAWAAGSSPLARGLPHRARARDRTARIIPARAGFTRRSRTPASLWRDHPRSRGVYRRSRRR